MLCNADLVVYICNIFTTIWRTSPYHFPDSFVHVVLSSATCIVLGASHMHYCDSGVLLCCCCHCCYKCGLVLVFQMEQAVWWTATEVLASWALTLSMSWRRNRSSFRFGHSLTPPSNETWPIPVNKNTLILKWAGWVFSQCITGLVLKL